MPHTPIFISHDTGRKKTEVRRLIPYPMFPGTRNSIKAPAIIDRVRKIIFHISMGGGIGAPGIPGIPGFDAIFPGKLGIDFFPAKFSGKVGNVKSFPGNREWVNILPG